MTQPFSGTAEWDFVLLQLLQNDRVENGVCITIYSMS